MSANQTPYEMDMTIKTLKPKIHMLVSFPHANVFPSFFDTSHAISFLKAFPAKHLDIRLFLHHTWSQFNTYYHTIFNFFHETNLLKVYY